MIWGDQDVPWVPIGSSHVRATLFLLRVTLFYSGLVPFLLCFHFNHQVIDAQMGIMVGGGTDTIVKGNNFINCDKALHIDDRGMT